MNPLAGSEVDCPGLSLNYSIESDFSFSQHSWTWESEEFTETTEVSFHWTHEGNHRIFRASAGASVEIGGTVFNLHDGRVISDFLREGDFTAIVEENQTIKITVKGRTFDRNSNARMTGIFKLRPQVCEELADTTPPEVDCSLINNSLWPPNNKLKNVGLGFVVADDRDPHPSVEVKVFSDETDTASQPDAIDDGSILALRAERNGNSDGRVYLIIVTATDEAGNVGYDCCTVTVPHDQSKPSRNASQAEAAFAELECLLDGEVPSGYLELTPH